MRKQNKKQEVKCVFGFHDWQWSLTEQSSNTFIIAAVCRQCRKKNSKKITVFNSTDAFIEFAKHITYPMDLVKDN